MNYTIQKLTIISVGALALGGTIFGLNAINTDDLIQRLDNIYQNPNPLIRHFSPTWRSLKKIADIYYVPQTFFYTSTLPAYELTLSKNDFFTLLAAIPYDPARRKSSLTDEYKETVRGRFRAENLDTEAKIRYRGLLANHGEIFSDQDIDLTERIDYLRSGAFPYWTARVNSESHAYDEALAHFLSVISDTSDEEFVQQIPRILDMEKFYGWALESLLARNYHQKNIVNLNFYFDPARGLFEPIATDMYSDELGDAYRVKHHRLLNRIFAHEPFRKQFETLARSYVDNPRNLEDDLAYYDTVTNSIKKDIMADTEKSSLTSEFLSYYKEHREVIIKNVQKIQAWLRDGGSLPLIFSDETYPLGGFTAK